MPVPNAVIIWPSTKKISLSSGFLLEQSASLPGKLEISNADLRRVTSRAFLAATRALDAMIPFSTMILATFGFSYKKRSKCSENNRSTIWRTSELPNFVFVWPSNCGLPCFIETTAVKPSRVSSPERRSLSSLIILLWVP